MSQLVSIVVAMAAISTSAWARNRELFLAAPPAATKIRRLLIANRGEIACRVSATCRKLNITTIAIFTDPDRDSQHVRDADEAVCLGPVEQCGGNPHLNIGLLIKTALDAGADAIHPGYGYLSENADFARRVADANLIFVGPSPHAMSVLGDKRAAKEYLARHDPRVPLIPGYNGSEQDPEALGKLAETVGFPILIKASAGGGGKGMRIVHKREAFQEELSRARSEALRSFGSADCILERYVERGKHVEIQIVGDSHGTVISLLDRDCSIQRRHQKVIEEAPCSWLPPALREDLSAAAVRIGKLLGYESAGTIEFMVDVDTKEFFFLEMNTRIQVEHCITEEITGVDIVALQIYIASRGKLSDLEPLRNIKIQGHSIECRLCAEDPRKDFLANSGKIWRWTPATEILPISQTRDVRFETALRSGGSVSVHFDSMIAKVVVWATSRSLAIDKMLNILSHTVCIGIHTNQLFLQACLLHEAFRKPNYSTGFILQNLNQLLRNPYIDNASAFQIRMGILSSYLLRRSFQSPKLNYSHPFSTVALRYRNQKADIRVGQADVIQILTSAEPSSPISDSNRSALVSWLPQSSSGSDIHMAQICPVLNPASSNSMAGALAGKPGTAVVAQFLQITGPLMTMSKASGDTHSLVVRNTLFAQGGQQTRHLAPFVDLDFDLDGERTCLYSVIPSGSATGNPLDSQRIFCHFPKLGTFVEYSRHTLLNFCESLRTTVDAEDNATGGALKAPMPCKVQSILKENGAQVCKGDVLLVIESMKTDIKMLAEKDGVFDARVQEGDAIDEGVVLCVVT